MEKWRRRLMRLMLPFGIAWVAFGVLGLVGVAQSAEPRPLAVLTAIIYITGGIVFLSNWWLYRHEVR